MSAEEIVLSVPRGALLFVDYTSGTKAGVESKSRRRAHAEAELAVEAGMHASHFVGRLVSAERVVPPGSYAYVLFRMICLNRGDPGAPQVRTFSTRIGTLHGALLLETPRA